MWSKFNEYLLNQNLRKVTISDRINYAKKYYHLLTDDDTNFEELLTLKPDKRLHVMVALTSLSKFIGLYDKWQVIRKRYNLKWSKDNSLSVFENIVNKEGLNEMIQWIKDSVKEFPQYADIIIFNTLTGLRPEEARKSFSLFYSAVHGHTKRSVQYFDKERMLLEHFKFPALFIRRTKKAFVSIIIDEILQLVESHNNENLPSYNAMRKVFQRRGKELNMLYCRKIFATYLRSEGLESEIIDLLQGRIPNSIFVKHYYRPDLSNIFERIREKIVKLHEIIK